MADNPLTHHPGEQATINLFGLHLPWKAALAVILTTTLVLTDYYFYPLNALRPPASYRDILLNKALERTVIYLLIPLFTILVIYREKPADYGFTVGDWRPGLKWTLIAWAIAAPILVAAGRSPEMIEYYTTRYAGMPTGELVGIVSLDLFGWEFIFRGLLLFALYRVAGPTAVVLQAVPFAMGHIGKPALETLSTIFGGTAFGWVAWRTRSFLYPWLIHCFISLLAIVVALSAG